jgi:hypothetical protein
LSLNKALVAKASEIEFFPAMVSKDCTGYFKFFESNYRVDYRNAFRKGTWPRFFVNTRVKGVWLNVHPKCETLEFLFDLATLELVDYEKYDHTPGLIYGYDGFHCKTHCAGVKIHILVCNIIELTEKYIDYSRIDDEAGFHAAKNIKKAIEAFGGGRTVRRRTRRNIYAAQEETCKEKAVHNLLSHMETLSFRIPNQLSGPCLDLLITG